MGELGFTVRTLAERLGGTLEGDGDAAVTGIASVSSAGPGDVTFVMDAARAAALATSKAAAAIVAEDAPAASIPLIRVSDVQASVAELLGIIGDNEQPPPAGIHPSAVIARDAEIGRDVAVGPAVTVAAGARIGDGAVLCAHVSIGEGVTIGEAAVLLEGTVVQARSRIGRRCRIGPNAVIGASGFGYYFAEGRHHRVPHTGTVEIGDDVDIGAGSCVDRAKFGATRIGDGTKIDNLVQVAHNVQIGRGCLLAGLAGIGGSAVLKDHVVLAGNAGVRDNVIVGTGVRAAACSALFHDVPDGATVAGIPAIDAGLWRRGVTLFARLTELRDRISKLEKKAH